MDSVDVRDCAGEIAARAATWTQSAVFARELGARTAMYSAHGTRTFSELDGNANRLARALRGAGLRRGDGLLLMCRNRPEFCETYLAAMRIGVRLIPVNTHLNAAEVGYIAADSRARALVTEAALEAGAAAAAVLQDRAALVAIDGAPAGFTDYRSMLAESSPAEIESPEPGTQMLYTSGTTGHPKGVFRPEPEITLPQYGGTHANYDPATDVNLCAGPAYHAAPLLMDIRWPLASGVPIVLLERWDTLRVLELIERHRVTHTHLVPTMFQRLLALPQEVRRAHDVSTLRFVVHGAAPCPVAVKRAMIEWLGPVIYEYYAGTEGGEGINITSQEWLRKPGSVGRFNAAFGHRILDERGNAVPQGQVGRVYFEAPRVNRFEYFNDPEKTARTYAGGLFTLGDLGYVDEDGYLFLTGRTAESIISGGVNIFPQEVDNELHTHPAVQDVCTVGVPSEEWGEEVCTVVVLRDGYVASDKLAAELIAYTRARLAHYKCPRTIRFAAELPRLASGKVQRDVVRAQFWNGRSRSI